MSNISFNEFIEAKGRLLWNVTRTTRGQAFHGLRTCPARLPGLLTKEPTECQDCEAMWEDVSYCLWSSGKRVTSESIHSATIDALRSLRVHNGMSSRPDRDLATAKWAQDLRAVSWIVPVLVELAYFAASRDECETEWPYQRIAQRVPDLPEQGSVYAVSVALAVINFARPEWADRNLHRPASTRIRRSDVVNA